MNACNSHHPFVRSTCSTLALAALWLGSLGCIFEGKVGDEPTGSTSDDDSQGYDTSVIESSTSMGPGHSSATPGTDGGVTTSPTAGVDCGDIDGSTALELCGIVLTEPVPGGPLYEEGIVCEGGESLDIVSGAVVDLYSHGECLCAAMGCGELLGGTTGEFPGDGWGSGEIPDSTGDTMGDTMGDTTGEPDGCGPYPPGSESYICECETCSSVLTNVDEQWLLVDADLDAVCECMCGWAGCGMPL